VEPPFRVGVTLTGRPRSRVVRRIAGARARDIRAAFTTIGGCLAWVDVESPVRYSVLFTAQPDGDGGCRTQVVFFLPRGPLACARALATTYALLHDDRRILDGIDFHPGFTERDAPLRAYVESVNAMATW
jgi:hypothetical protein